MKNISFEDFLAFSKTLDGKTLKTKALGKEFKFQVDKRGFIYIPASTGIPRLHTYKFLKPVFDRNMETKSFRPGHYVDISANASYALTIIDRYINREPEEIEEIKDDFFSLHRKPTEGTIDIEQGQTGISYRSLFAPYLAGARRIKLIDPYIRYGYQIQNFINFCECLSSTQDGIQLTLTTSAETKEQERELSAKLNELRHSLEQHRIRFVYSFEKNIHDRLIEIDTGWRIILGRGLDIFQKREGKFTLGLTDQTKRRCKKTTITYAKIKT